MLNSNVVLTLYYSLSFSGRGGGWGVGDEAHLLIPLHSTPTSKSLPTYQPVCLSALVSVAISSSSSFQPQEVFDGFDLCSRLM